MTQTKNEVLSAAFRLLTYRDRTAWELTERLQERFSPDLVAEAVAYLEETGYVNDLRFARNYVDSRNRSRPRGNYLLQLELKRKGVAQSLLEQVLNEPEFEYELALSLARQRLAAWKNIETAKSTRRLLSLLQRRGFPWSAIRRVRGELLDRDSEKEYN